MGLCYVRTIRNLQICFFIRKRWWNGQLCSQTKLPASTGDSRLTELHSIMGQICPCLSLSVTADPVLSCSHRQRSLNYCEVKMDCVKRFKVSLFCKWSVAAIKGLGPDWRRQPFIHTFCVFASHVTRLHLRPTCIFWVSAKSSITRSTDQLCVCSPLQFGTLLMCRS